MRGRNSYTGLGPSHARRRWSDDPGVGSDDPGFGGPDDPGRRPDDPVVLEQLRKGRMSGPDVRVWPDDPGPGPDDPASC